MEDHRQQINEWYVEAALMCWEPSRRTMYAANASMPCSAPCVQVLEPSEPQAVSLDVSAKCMCVVAVPHGTFNG